MGMVEAVRSVLTNFANFNDRARRSEYWYFVLANLIASMALNLIDGDANWLSNLLALALLVPGIAVAVRRLHDIGKSGWFVLLGLIPIVGWIILIVWAAQDSQPGDNIYGPNPKGV